MNAKRIFDGDRVILIFDKLSAEDKKKVESFVDSLGTTVSNNCVRGLAPLPMYNNPSSCTYKYLTGPYKGKTFFESIATGGRAALYALEHISEFPQKEVEIVKQNIRKILLTNLNRRNPETDPIADVREFEMLYNIKPFESLFRDTKNIAGFSDMATFFKYGNGEVVREAYASLIDKIKDVVARL